MLLKFFCEILFYFCIWKWPKQKWRNRRAVSLNKRRTMAPNDSSDAEEIVNVYSYSYNRPQPYNYEPAVRAKEQGHPRNILIIIHVYPCHWSWWPRTQLRIILLRGLFVRAKRENWDIEREFLHNCSILRLTLSLTCNMHFKLVQRIPALT